MKNFFAEFKKFITRGNVVDMAVGVTVGSAFTAVVNGFTNNIIKPLINYVIALIVGDGALTDAFTFLKTAYVAVVDEAGEVVGYTSEIDLANSIYIDWGAFINAIINFLLIAFVLFCIVRVFNRLREGQGKFADAMKSGRATKAERAEMKKLGMNPRNLEQLDSYRDAKAKEAAKAAEAEKAAAEAAAAEEAAKAAYAAAAPERQEALLREIVELLKNK
ncbi:MAG: large conductance mechanosensitive channel protein MscL [Clostridia bacterium]|nr:large conductance mechanosensitive channel protein MscL [Clostridia bacterium]